MLEENWRRGMASLVPNPPSRISGGGGSAARGGKLGGREGGGGSMVAWGEVVEAGEGGC